MTREQGGSVSPLRDVEMAAVPLDRLAAVLDGSRVRRLIGTAARLRETFAGRTLWNVNSTASGGGVAEMLQVLVGYEAGAGIDARWAVISADGDFFAVTKRIHHWVHGADGDNQALGDHEAAIYERVMASNGDALRNRVRRGDVVILHDPQTAGLVCAARAAGAHVVWRCHIGATTTNDRTNLAWEFLRGHLDTADAFVFSRRQYVPSWMPLLKTWVIPPSIDPFSPKNQMLPRDTVRSILSHIGVLDPNESSGSRRFVRRDGTTGEIHRRADIVASGDPPSADVPLVVQVSRWDPLKDMAGVMEAFARIADKTDAALALVGPAVSGVTDDPEGAAVFAQCVSQWQHLPSPIRDRIALVSLPMADVDENAAMVNAIQRHAAVVLQKSLAEGFGLTVAEAMYKRRAVIASDVGGIPDQVAPGTGVLLADPSDLDVAGHEIVRLTTDAELRSTLGDAAHQQIHTNYLGDRHLIEYARLLENLTT
jgi:trehalose synthase